MRVEAMNRMSLARRSAAVLLSALTLQAASLPSLHAAARAQGAPSVVVLPLVAGPGASEASAAALRGLLETELQRRDALSVVSLPTGGAPGGPGAADPNALLDEGQQRLANLEFEAAAERLRAGIAAMTARPESIDWGRLIEAQVSLAVASFRRGDEESAQKALAAVVRLAPEYALAEGKYPPIFVREFDKARRRAEKQPRGNVHVDGPPGAVAWVDGKDLGMVPVVQENLGAGTHYVKVEGTRGELFGGTVELRSREAKVVASFSGASGAPAVAVGPVLNDAAVQAAQTACRDHGAQFAVVGVVYRAGEHQVTGATAVFSAAARGFLPLRTFTFDRELLTANVEVFRLADALEQAVLGSGRPAPSGHDLAAGVTWKPGQAVAAAPRDVDAPVRDGRRSALAPGQESRTAREDEESRLRALEGAGHPAPTGRGEVKSGSRWWLWTLVGAGVLVAAGGTAYGVHQASQPVTGTVTARW
jgi:hypothetical protein